MLTKLFVREYVPSVPGTSAQMASHTCPPDPPYTGESSPGDSGAPAPEGCHWGIVCGEGGETGACTVGLICD